MTPSPFSNDTAQLPDKDSAGDVLSSEHDVIAQLSNEQKSTLNDSKRRRRRESHNVVERRRRDTIHEHIGDLFKLLPSNRRKTNEKGDVIEATVSWTRDLIWAHHLKLKREADTEDLIVGQKSPISLADLPPSMPRELTIDREVQSSLAENNITCFSSSDHSPYHTRRASEPLPKYSIPDATTQLYRPQRRLRKTTSRGSIISYVASVHSVTSLTYWSPTGDIRTETYGNKSTVTYLPEDKSNVSYNPDEGILGPTSDTVSHSVLDDHDTLEIPWVYPETKSTDADSSRSKRNIPKSESELTPNVALSADNRRSSDTLDQWAERPLQQSISQQLEEGSHSRKKYVDFIEYEPAGPGDLSVPRNRDTSVGNLPLDRSKQAEDASDLAPRLAPGWKQAKASSDQDQAIKEGSSDSLDAPHLDQPVGGVKPDNDRSISGAGYTVTYLENGLVRLRWRCVSFLRGYMCTKIPCS